MNLIVFAKAPLPGRTKTRMCPPLTPVEAADFAEAALADTLAAAATCSAERRVLVLDGPPGQWVRDGFHVIPQRGRALGDRLQAAFDDAGAPALLIGMDTPQVSTELLDRCLSALSRPAVDVVLGMALDGGWWAMGVQRHAEGLFEGVRMSTTTTGAEQAGRLAALRLRTVALAPLRDVDRIDDALAVAWDAPGTRSARWVRRWLARRAPSPPAQADRTAMESALR
jgi:rSAM/selenodomain-associated transferase 1